MGFIYCITNKINGKKYIGKTERTLEDRFEGHLRGAKYGNQTYLYRAMRKHGEDNFVIEQIEECQNVDEREQFWITEFDTLIPSGYNMTKGGTGGDTSISPNYIEGMKKRDYSGSGNPNYGKKGPASPKFGKKYGKKPLISEGQRRNWNNNPDRKKKLSERMRGENNPRYKHGRYVKVKK